MHTRILYGQKFDGSVASKSRVIKRLLVHFAHEIMLFGVVSQPPHDFSQFARCGAQITLDPIVIGADTKEIVHRLKKPDRKPYKVGPAELIV